MAKIDFKAIAAHALQEIRVVLNHWCPGGKQQGCEYVVRNPTRNDKTAGSFSINLNDGTWSDFATGDKGGDLVALVAYLDGVNNAEAANRVAEFLGIEPGKSSANKPPAALKTPKNNNDGLECVMPVPDYAPKPIVEHYKHGKPSKRYCYQDVSCLVNFYHDRFEPKQKGGRKQFAPLTLWRSQSGDFVWRYKAPPKNRPLYNLQYLSSQSFETVWIVEGEKAADAFLTLFPDRTVITWQGGTQAINKTDFSSLKGRDCVIWPDNDQPGVKALQSLNTKLNSIGVGSIKYVDLNALTVQLRRFKFDLAHGDDVADLKEFGLSSDNIDAVLTTQGVVVSSEHLQSEQLAVEAENSQQILKRHFLVLDNGVYLVDVSSNHDAYKPPKFICSKLEALASTRSSNQETWGLLVRFHDQDSHEHRFVIPAKSFNGNGLEATGVLFDRGLRIAPQSTRYVLEYLQTQMPEKRARITNRIGWHQEAEHYVYMLPSGIVGGSVDEWLLDSINPNESGFKAKGTLEGWRENVARLAVGNSRLLFAIAIAFASPLRHIVDMKDLGGFHYRGASSDGKSTALRIGASVCGGPVFMQRWRASDNGLEGLAMMHCDAPLYLDELKQIDPKVAGEAAYMLTNGTGKTRANERGGARKTSQWRVMFLSAGEISLSQHMQDANKRTHAGQEIRMADIPSDAGAGHGCFENLHGMANGSVFAQRLADAASENYGLAFPAFIEWVQTQDRYRLKEGLILAQQSFVNSALSESASGQARRVASLFALVGAAGELATKAGITGWQQGQSHIAAKDCFMAWLENFGGEGDQESRSMIAQVRLFLEQHGEGRFADIDRNAVTDNHSARVLARAGYRKHKTNASNLQDETTWMVFPETFRTEVCKGFDYRAVVRLLVDRGYMHKGDGRNIGHPKRETPEGKRRVYVIYGSIMEGSD